MFRSPQFCHRDRSRSSRAMTYGVEGPCVFVLGERLWGSRGNRRHESTKERQENSVHCRTQAKTRLEWGTRPTHNAAQTLMANLQQNCQAKPISSQLPFPEFPYSGEMRWGKRWASPLGGLLSLDCEPSGL